MEMMKWRNVLDDVDSSNNEADDESLWDEGDEVETKTVSINEQQMWYLFMKEWDKEDDQQVFYNE